MHQQLRSASPQSLHHYRTVLHSRRAGHIDSQLHALARHDRYSTSVPCFTLTALSAWTIALLLATVATSLPHRASTSPNRAHRFTTTCSSLPRPLRHLRTVLHSHRAERIDNYAPPRHGRYTTTAPCFTLAELGASTHNYILQLSTVATLPLHRASLSPSGARQSDALSLPRCFDSPRSLHHYRSVLHPYPSWTLPHVDREGSPRSLH